MVPWALYFALQLFVLSETFAGGTGSRLHNSGVALQSEIEDYLRALTQSQHAYKEPIVRQATEDGSPYLSSKGTHYLPPNVYPFQDYVNEQKLQNPQAERGIHAFASSKSSVQIKKPLNKELEIDAKAIAYSSVKDVESEKYLDGNEESFGMFTRKDPDKKSETSQQMFTVSEDRISVSEARKADDLTTFQQNSEILKAENYSDVYFVAIVAGCSAVGIFGIISAGICFYKLQKTNKASADVEYPAYGVTGPSKETTSPSGDRKLAHSAQMYHYQHQKQQMIAVEKAGSTKNTSASDVDSEEENEEGDYTVYECPGLAPTGEMEVKNPLFNDDSTPMSPSILPTKPPDDVQTK